VQFGTTSDRLPLRMLVADADEITIAPRGDEWAVAESNVRTHVQHPNLAKELYIPTGATPPSSSNQHGWGRSIEMTLSRVTTLVIESLAIYSWSFYPHFSEPPEHEMELQNPAAAAQSGPSAHDETNAPAASGQEAIIAVPTKPELSAS
jgi:hypothetical protein